MVVWYLVFFMVFGLVVRLGKVFIDLGVVFVWDDGYYVVEDFVVLCIFVEFYVEEVVYEVV